MDDSEMNSIIMYHPKHNHAFTVITDKNLGDDDCLQERVSNDSSTIFNTENLFRVADYGVPIVEDVCLCTTPRDNSSNDSTSLILIIGMACAGVAVCCCLYFGWRLCRSKMRRSRERR